MDITTLIILAAIFGASIGTVFVAKKLGIKGKALTAIQAAKFIVDDAIKAAEQHKKNDGWTNEQAKDFAVDRIFSHLSELDLDEYISIETVDLIVEGAVGAYNLVRGLFPKPKPADESADDAGPEPQTV